MAEWENRSTHNPATWHQSVTIWEKLAEAADRHSSWRRRAQRVPIIPSLTSICSLQCCFDTSQRSFPRSCWSHCTSCVRGFYPDRSSDGLRLSGVPDAMRLGLTVIPSAGVLLMSFVTRSRSYVRK